MPGPVDAQPRVEVPRAPDKRTPGCVVGRDGPGRIIDEEHALDDAEVEGAPDAERVRAEGEAGVVGDGGGRVEVVDSVEEAEESEAGIGEGLWPQTWIETD